MEQKVHLTNDCSNIIKKEMLHANDVPFLDVSNPVNIAIDIDKSKWAYSTKSSRLVP